MSACTLHLSCSIPNCGAWAIVSGDTIDDVEHSRRALGWTRRNGKDVCPRCSDELESLQAERTTP